MKDDTQLTQFGRDRKRNFDFVNPPLVRGSTVLHDDVADMRDRISQRSAGADRPVTYGIYGSPTHHAFCDALTALEGGYASWALPSGLAACTVALLAYVEQGDHILVPDSVYWPVRRFCRETLTRFGVETTFYEPRIGPDLESKIRPTTRLLYLETPGSLTFEMQDIPLLAAIARERGIVTVIDNTWATPLYFKPIRHGVDVVVHAVTKYIGGHSDLIMGSVTSTEERWPALRAALHNFGQTTSPDDCWLALRGLRSLSARLARHRATADQLIAWLKRQPEVDHVLYPALPTDPGHAVWERDFSGASGLFGVVLKPIGAARVARLVDHCSLFGRGYSWGGFESLLIPSFPERIIANAHLTGPLIRISAGLEDPNDLIADLDAGFERMRATA